MASGLISAAVRDHYGSFRDSLRVPIHRWFTYPAGYSYKFVEAKILEYGLTSQSWVADPFLGTGTTSVVAKMMGVNSLGIEAHPFVFEVATTKMRFNYDTRALQREISSVGQRARQQYADGVDCEDVWPALVYKCFTTDNLQQLYALRSAILEHDYSKPTHVNVLKLALTATLRVVTTAGAGWPYIAPSKYALRTVRRDAFDEFAKRCTMMVHDILYVQQLSRHRNSRHVLKQNDARHIADLATLAALI